MSLKRCQKCGEIYPGWGGICGVCRKASGAAALVKVCPRCSAFLGPGTLCHEVDLSASEPVACTEETAEAVAASLANKGFTVEQILQFAITHHKLGLLKEDTTTAEVVRDIIIPQSADERCSYMEASFMRSYGGPQKANRLVSHSWRSPFANVVRNIIMDAGELPADDEAFCETDCLGVLPNRPVPFDAEAVLQRFIGTKVLQKTYWLCIFAVNQHISICGDCWALECNKHSAWVDKPVMHLTADPCLICAGKKMSPCPCGTPKTTEYDPCHEVDKFPRVVRRMKALVVSLDGEVATVTRAWVVAEIREAVACGVPVYFRMANALGDGPQSRVICGEPLVPSVRDCAASIPQDRDRIVAKIDQTPGGVEAYDAFVQLMLDMRFARCIRLSSVPKATEIYLEKVSYVCLDGSWQHNFTAMGGLVGLFGNGRAFGRLALLQLEISFATCQDLSDITELSEAVKTQEGLKELRLNLHNCSELGDRGIASSEAGGIASLGAAFKFLKHLERLELDVQMTQVGDSGLEAISRALPPGLQDLKLLMAWNNGVSDRGAGALARGLVSGMRALHLDLQSTQVGDDSAESLGQCLPTGLLQLVLVLNLTRVGDRGLQALAGGLPGGLQELSLYLRNTQVGDCGCDSLAAGLPACLEKLTLDFEDSKQVGDCGVEALARRLPGSLQELDLQLDRTKVGDSGATALGNGLPSNLQHLVISLLSTQVGESGAEALGQGLPSDVRTLKILFSWTGGKVSSSCVEHLKSEAAGRLGSEASIDIRRL